MLRSGACWSARWGRGLRRPRRSRRGGALAAIERSAPDVSSSTSRCPARRLAVCRRVRAKGLALPILLLTARDAVEDRVAGLDAGADDYLVKPFAAEELLARLRALLRRGRTSPESVSPSDDDRPRRAVAGPPTCRPRPRTEPARGRSARAAAAQRRGVVPREMALDRVWGGPASASPNVVDRYVAYLRRKLGDPPLIETVRGVGFMLGP